MPDITLTLTLTETGKFAMAGPLENRLLVYGLLALAQETMMKRPAGPPEGKPTIVVPDATALRLLK